MASPTDSSVPKSVTAYKSPANSLNKAKVTIKKQQIKVTIAEPEYMIAQGIIFIVGMYKVDGTEMDVKNITTTFRELNFAIFNEMNPPAEEIACLIQAAAEIEYPYNYKYVAFYFAGHGGRDKDGKMFIVGLQLDDTESDIEKLEIDQNIVHPLKARYAEKTKIRLFFFFDFGSNIMINECFVNVPNKEQKYRKNGKIGTYHLCKNLREMDKPIFIILAKTIADVADVTDVIPIPVIILDPEFITSPEGSIMILKKAGSTLIGNYCTYTVYGKNKEMMQFDWNKKGIIKINVPAGIVSDVSKCDITVTHLSPSHFNLPDDSILVSEIFEVTTSCKILKPITISLRHCVKLANEDETKILKFVKAERTNDSPFQFKLYEGGVFPVGLRYGKLSCQNQTIYGIIMKFHNIIYRKIFSNARFFYSATLLSQFSANTGYKAHILVTKNEPMEYHQHALSKIKHHKVILSTTLESIDAGENKEHIRIDTQEYSSDGFWRITESIKPPEIPIEQILRYTGTQATVPKCSYSFQPLPINCGTDLKHEFQFSGAVKDQSITGDFAHIAVPKPVDAAQLTASQPPAKDDPYEDKGIFKRQISVITKKDTIFQGILFTVGMSIADGTIKDVENITTAFKELNFAIFPPIWNPSKEKLAGLIQAAAKFEYPSDLKYVAFYFAGHGGRNKDGKTFVIALGPENDYDDIEILHIDKYIIDPLKCLGEKAMIRFFFFDCCQTEGDGNAFCDANMKKAKPHPGELIAYASSEDQESRCNDINVGGIWTHHLCKNLRKISIPITTILTDTIDDVMNVDQNPIVINKGVGTICLKKAEYLAVVKAIYGYEAMRADELTFNEGDILYILEKGREWWNAKSCGLQIGLVPYNYIETVTEDPLLIHEALERGNANNTSTDYGVDDTSNKPSAGAST